MLHVDLSFLKRNKSVISGQLNDIQFEDFDCKIHQKLAPLIMPNQCVALLEVMYM